MKKVIRNGVFETNSSSTHSITIRGGKYKASTIPLDKDGVCNIYPGEFGWDVADFYDAPTKASYCLTYIKSHEYGEEMLKNVIRKATKAKEVKFIQEKEDFFGGWGYIDHQSSDVCGEAFKSEDQLMDFIFNPASVLHTDNDNHP